jgi:hypothetical protein
VFLQCAGFNQLKHFTESMSKLIALVLLLPSIIQHGAARVVPDNVAVEATTFCTGGVKPPTAVSSTLDISKCAKVAVNENCVVGCANNFVIKQFSSAPKAFKCTTVSGKLTLTGGTFPSCVGMHASC